MGAMKQLRYIALVLPLAVLLLAGGGVGLMRCACSGQVSLLLPDDGCCADGGCMTTAVVSFDDATLADAPLGVSPLVAVAVLPEVPQAVACACGDVRAAADVRPSPPPRLARLPWVLRV